jgi:hypothetical protein
MHFNPRLTKEKSLSFISQHSKNKLPLLYLYNRKEMASLAVKHFRLGSLNSFLKESYYPICKSGTNKCSAFTIARGRFLSEPITYRRLFASAKKTSKKHNESEDKEEEPTTRKPAHRRGHEKTDSINLFLLRHLFPNCSLQLHIFEPRYQIMVEEALNFESPKKKRGKKKVEGELLDLIEPKKKQFGLIASSKDEFKQTVPSSVGTLVSILRHSEDKGK